MSKLKIDFVDDTEDVYAHFILRHEGMSHMRLPACYLREFIEALETPTNEVNYFWESYYVQLTKGKVIVSKYANPSPLLQLDSGMCAKLISYFKEKYTVYCS